MRNRNGILAGLACLLMAAGCGSDTDAASAPDAADQAASSSGNSAQAPADNTPDAKPVDIAVGQASPLDKDGCQDHPAMSRYPETILTWCAVENFLPFKIPLGPVTGYRTIGKWEETAGRVTRNFYEYRGDGRTHSEIYLNYLNALRQAGFEILGEGVFAQSNTDRAIGGRNWQGVYFKENAWQGHGPVSVLVSGTSSSGGSGAIIARKKRLDGPIYVVVSLERHSDELIGALVDIVEAKEAEIGLVTANAEAMGRDIEEYGRTVIEGLMFDHDKATLKPESKPALEQSAKLLKSLSGKSFFVVGHTDSAGTYAYNRNLSEGRAASVRKALIDDYGIAPARLQAIGVGPVSPVFTNASDGGKEKNRRVELVEQ